MTYGKIMLRKIILTESGWWLGYYGSNRWYGPYRWKWMARARSWLPLE